MNGLPLGFCCPPDMVAHCAKVFAGEYDVPIDFGRSPHVLDVGANVGAFSIWACHRWPGATVSAYEPNPKADHDLRRNLTANGGGVQAHLCAVRAEAGRAKLYSGRHNLGEASLSRGGDQTDEYVDVDCIAAASLDDCDVLKIDTEGCELEILTHYTGRPSLVLLEFHSRDDRVRIDRLMCWARGYGLLRADVHHLDRGTLAYVDLRRLQA